MSERNDIPHKIAEVLRAISGKTDKKYYTSAIILAGGSSSRMGGESKQFIAIDGLPVVARTVKEFDASPCIDEIIIVSKKEEMCDYEGFAEKYGIKTPITVVEGGSTRQESARAGVDTVNKKSKFVAIHDAARCLITTEMIYKVCHGAYLHGGAILAVKAVDTVKIADKNAFIVSTPERKYTWQAQTPQVFKTNAFRAATYVARDESYEGTDDASLLEHIHIPVKLVEGSRENIKITERSDVYFAEAVLRMRKDEAEKSAENTEVDK